MTTLYAAAWIVPVATPPLAHGAVAVDGGHIVAVDDAEALKARFPDAAIRDFGDAAITPGLVNAHSHLELTAMRGFLEKEETNFFAWLRKLTLTRLEQMTADDLYVSAAWGACEAARAGVTCFGDASDGANESIKALRDTGLRGIVFKESFGPDPRLAVENFHKLESRVCALRSLETSLVKVGVSPHAPYTVCAPQLEMISRFAREEHLPVMMHAAETTMEVSLLARGEGPFAEGLKTRGIDWQTPGVSTIRHLEAHGVLETQPLLAHCIHVDDEDARIIAQTNSRVAHCPKSNAKLRHGIAPFAKFLEKGIAVGLGSDSVASNNTCDLIEEARFALLTARAFNDSCDISAADVLQTATAGGARALGMENEIGQLREGLQADLTVVSLDGAHQNPSYDVISTLIFSSSGRDVLMTMVAGREVFRDGRVTTVNEDELRDRMIELAQRLVS